MSAYEVRFEASNGMCPSSKKLKEEAREIIEDRVPTFIGKTCKPKTLEKTRRVRLDLQEYCVDKSYANLQIQLNATTKSDGLTDESEEEGENVVSDGPRSTTIAIVLMPTDEHIPEDDMKKAFNGSLEHGTKAIVFKKR